MTIEDVIKKSILPLAFMVFWFWMTKTIMKVSGQTDWFWWIFIAGLPFGIHKMRLILIPRGMDTTATLGMAALSVIIGAYLTIRSRGWSWWNFDTMKGDHISCMNSPYIEENVKKILDL